MDGQSKRWVLGQSNKAELMSGSMGRPEDDYVRLPFNDIFSVERLAPRRVAHKLLEQPREPPSNEASACL